MAKISKNFWENVDIRGKGECWNWKSNRKTTPLFSLNGKTTTAARVAFMLSGGEFVGDDTQARHTCRNLRCCNPSHIKAGRSGTRDSQGDAFWSRLEEDPITKCKNWTGYRVDNRYGRVGFAGRYYLAHRLAFTLIHGEIPAGMDVCHACDNPLCCNVQHLFLGTHSDNMADMKAKGRNTFGERHHTAKLNSNEVTELRRRFKEGESPSSLARQFKITKRSVYQIARGDTWKHLAAAILIAILLPLMARAETPNWSLFDQRMSEKISEYSTRFDFGSYDDKLAASYYDYANGMEYLSRRLSNASLSIAAQKGGQFFADEYAIQYSGNVPGYWNFTDGLRRMYEITGQNRYKQAVFLMAQNAAFARDTTAEDTRQPEYSREVAYAIKAMLNAELLGAPRRDRLFTLVAHAQSHLEQWANGNAPYMRGFMFALTARSLIQYHDQVEPLGIRERIQAAANYWKACCWVEGARAFQYTDRNVGNPDDLNPQPDLNLLIAPVYAWLGDTEFAGKVFNGGVEQAWLGNVGNMKQFSQQLLWTEKFQQWTAAPTPSPTLPPVNTPTPSPSPTISPSPSPSPIPTPCKKSAAGNLTLKYLDCRISRIAKINGLAE